MNPALVISLVAVAISFLSTLWNVWAWRLTAPRIRTRFDIGAFTVHSLHRGPQILNADASAGRDIPNPHYYFEVICLTVENRGRTAATANNVAMELYPSRPRPPSWMIRRFSRLAGRRTVTPHLVPWDRASSEIQVRLEPFSSTMFLLRPEPILNFVRDGHRAQYMCASVEVAGRSRPRRSNLRGRLHLPPGIHSFSGGRPPSDLVVYRAALASSGKFEDEDETLARRLAAVARNTPDFERMTMHDAMVLLDEEIEKRASAPDSIVNLAGFYAAQALRDAGYLRAADPSKRQ